MAETGPLFEKLCRQMVEKGAHKTITLEYGMRNFGEIPKMKNEMGPLLDQTMFLINKWLENCDLLSNPSEVATFQSIVTRVVQKELKRRGY